MISKLLSNSLYHPLPHDAFVNGKLAQSSLLFMCLHFLKSLWGFFICLGGGAQCASVISSESINYKALEIKIILAKKSAILEEENRTKMPVTYRTLNPKTFSV